MYVLFRLLWSPGVAAEDDVAVLCAPQWRSLLISASPYASAMLPCHYQCCLGHSLFALLHFAVFFLLIIAVEYQLQPRTATMEGLSFLVAALIASCLQPAFNVSFYHWRAADEVVVVEADDFVRGEDEKTTTRRRSVYIIAPEDLRADDDMHHDIKKAAAEDDMEALYDDSDGDDLPVFPMPMAAASSEDITGSATGSTGEHMVDMAAFEVHMLDDFETFDRERSQHPNVAGTVFDLFDNIDRDDWVPPTPAARRDASDGVPTKLLEALAMMEEAEQQPGNAAADSTAGRLQQPPAIDISDALTLFHDGLDALRFETGVDSTGAVLVPVGLQDFDDVDGAARHAAALTFFDDDSDDGNVVAEDAPADVAHRSLFAPDDTGGGVAATLLRVRPQLPQAVPPEYLKHLVDACGHSAPVACQSAALADNTFLDDVLEEESLLATGDAEQIEAARRRAHATHDAALEALQEQQFAEGRGLMLQLEAEREERVRKALEPAVFDPWVHLGDGVLEVEIVSTRHGAATVAIVISCVALLVVLYHVLQRSDTNQRLCGTSHTQNHYYAALLIDVGVQVVAVGALYAYRHMVASELDLIPSELHPYNGQQRARCRQPGGSAA